MNKPIPLLKFPLDDRIEKASRSCVVDERRPTAKKRGGHPSPIATGGNINFQQWFLLSSSTMKFIPAAFLAVCLATVAASGEVDGERKSMHILGI